MTQASAGNRARAFESVGERSSGQRTRSIAPRTPNVRAHREILLTVTDFWIAIVAAIVGGLAGYLASFFQASRELERRRKAIATALLADLTAIEVHIADTYDGASADDLKKLPPASILGRFSDYVDVLSGETTHALSVVSATLDSMQGRYTALRIAHSSVAVSGT